MLMSLTIFTFRTCGGRRKRLSICVGSRGGEILKMELQGRV